MIRRLVFCGLIATFTTWAVWQASHQRWGFVALDLALAAFWLTMATDRTELGK